MQGCLRRSPAALSALPSCAGSATPPSALQTPPHGCWPTASSSPSISTTCTFCSAVSRSAAQRLDERLLCPYNHPIENQKGGPANGPSLCAFSATSSTSGSARLSTGTVPPCSSTQTPTSSTGNSIWKTAESRAVIPSPNQTGALAPDCDRWAQIAKSAGCRFAVLTAKHHEGFALWPSEFGNHSVAQATVRTDIVSGIPAGLPRSRSAGRPVLLRARPDGRDRAALLSPAQRELVLGQITELLTNYGEIPYLIIDGWNAPWGGPSYRELPFEGSRCPRQASAAELPAHEYRLHGGGISPARTSSSLKTARGRS